MKLYLNCSPRLVKSNTQAFIDTINEDNSIVEYLYKINNYHDLNLEKYEKIIIGFPLYVDSPPNKLLELMEYILDKEIKLKNTKIYLIINCGFLESYHNIIAKDIIKNFCNKINAKYNGSILIGAGEVSGKYKTNKLYKLASQDTIKKLIKLKEAIDNDEYIELETTIHPMTKKAYIKIANLNFKRQMKKID